MRKPEIRKIYHDRLLCITLCQGAALHYIDGKNGIKDFDVWSFFHEHPQRPFPYRRNVPCDFGDPKFGKSLDRTDFIGRRVDLIGRSIPYGRGEKPIDTLRKYLTTSKNISAKLLSRKAVIILYPEKFIGEVVWPILNI